VSPVGGRGQASVELAAGAAVALMVSLLALQVLAAGYAAVMADHAAEAGALALANGRPAADAARSAVPGWPQRAAHVQVEGDMVRVTLVPPSPFAFLRGRLSATGRAVVRRPVASAGRWDR
jgi:hypothetical protein